MKGTVGRLLAAAVMIAAVGGAGSAARAAERLPAPDAVIVKSGDVRITRATVDRWALARRDSPLLDPGRRVTGAITNAERREVLSRLLDLHTMVLEARRLHVDVAVSDMPVIARELRAGARELLPAPATAADRALWLNGQLATYALLTHGMEALPPLSDARLRELWQQQREPGWFAPRQVRAEVVELDRRATAQQALAALRSGESFVSVGARLSGVSPVRFHGEPQLFTGPQADADDESPLLRALMKARPAVLIGPIRSGDSWYVARVVEVVAERARIPLAQVRERLQEEAEFAQFGQVARAVAATAARYWRARTTCARPFVVRRQCGRVVARPLR